MIVQKRGDVSIYNLTAGPSLPEWISDRARRNLSKKDEGVRRRIELLQDFGMPASSTKIRQSPDGRYFMATGTYPPRVRCYDTQELGMKFERYVTSGVVDLCMLGQDYGKFCLLQDDRTLAFHAPYGAHESIRIPTFGRALAYESTTCELLVAAKGDALYRVNLDEGRFQQPWQLQSDTSASCLAVHPVHPLTTAGCEDGTLRFWDSRNADHLVPFLRLDVASALRGQVDSYASMHSDEITAVANDDSALSNGMHMAVGTATGLVAVYDIRSSRPLAAFPHRAGLPIHTLQFHNSGHGSELLLLSGDEKLIQASSVKEAAAATASSGDWEGTNGNAKVAKFHIEATSRFHHFCVAAADDNLTGSSTSPPSGLILCATDQPKMEAFYVPAIGVAPRWCSYLEGITEELHERDLSRDSSGGGLGGGEWAGGHETVYDSYQFVSRDDVEKLGIAHLVGTPLLRGYMHGYFMDANLYRRVQAIANPFEYEDYQKKKLKERIDAKRSSRIAPKSTSSSSKRGKSAAVNPDLAERLEAKASLASGKGAKELLQDDRFGSLFTNKDFEIDPENEDFKLRNPSGVAALRRRQDNMDSDDDDDDDDNNNDNELAAKQRLDKAGEQYFDDGAGNSSEDDDGDESDDSNDIGFKGVKVRGEEYEAMKALTRKSKQPSAGARTAPSGKKRAIRMVETEDGGVGKGSVVGLGLGHHDATQRVRKRLEELQVPLGKRMSQQHKQQQGGTSAHRSVQVRVQGGSKEATYVPRDAKGDKKQHPEDEGDPMTDGSRGGKRNRRGVKELGLKRLR